MQDLIPDRELTREEFALVKSLTEEQLAVIDKTLLSHMHPQYSRKVAYLVGMTIIDMPEWAKEIPDVFYSQRIAQLVAQEHLVAQGDLKRMRYCEVSFP